jgi:hypothetical protein
MCGLLGHTYNECLVFYGKPGVTTIPEYFQVKCYNDMSVPLWNISACVLKYRHRASGAIARKHKS